MVLSSLLIMSLLRMILMLLRLILLYLTSRKISFLLILISLLMNLMICLILLLFMKTFDLSDSEIDVIRYAVKRLQRDIRSDMSTYLEHNNLDALQSSVNFLSSISFILSKINF